MTLVDSGGTEVISGDGTARGTMVGSDGTLFVFSGFASGTIVSLGGTETVRHAGMATSTTVSNGGFEVLSLGGVANFTTVDSGGTEVVSGGGSPISTTVSGGGSIDVAFLGYTNGASADINSTTDVLTVLIGGQIFYTQQLAGDYAGEFAHVRPDSNGGTLVTVNDTAPCFCAGTCILTARGEIAVE